MEHVGKRKDPDLNSGNRLQRCARSVEATPVSQRMALCRGISHGQ